MAVDYVNNIYPTKYLYFMMICRVLDWVKMLGSYPPFFRCPLSLSPLSAMIFLLPWMTRTGAETETVSCRMRGCAMVTGDPGVTVSHNAQCRKSINR